MPYVWRHFFPPLTEELAKVREEDPSAGPSKFKVIYNRPQLKCCAPRTTTVH
jgi:hypothetical protein